MIKKIQPAGCIFYEDDSMFIDEVKISVKGGDGGNGCVSLHREKFNPKGGPDGGNGGKGGDVILEGSSGMNTLSVFKKRVHILAERGTHGKGNNMHGKVGKDIVVKVPLGTSIYDIDSGDLIGDITEEGQRVVAAEGGRGGRGNAAFATCNYRVPRFAEKGEVVPAKWIKMELKLIAHVGLVGLPNAGKSTFLTAISAARPKIDSYPFTTISPNLGAVQAAEGVQYIFADIPGLIEGAHEGKGLGDRFLRHVSRNKMLVHLIDLSEVDPESPLDNYNIILNELRQFDEDLSKRPTVVAANKIDLVGTEEAFFALQKELKKKGIHCFPISAMTGEGMEDLLQEIFRVLARVENERRQIEAEARERVIIDMQSEGLDQKQFTIEPVDDYFVVHGRGIERMVQMLDLDNDEAVYHLQNRIKRMGIEDELKRMGINEGDFVVIGNYEFNFVDDGNLERIDLPT